MRVLLEKIGLSQVICLLILHGSLMFIDVKLAQKTQSVLEYMVNQGFQIAFFVREQIQAF